MDFEWALLLQSLPGLWKGTIVTAKLSILSIVLGLAIGIAGGMARLSKIGFVRLLMSFYVNVTRAVPLLVTLLFLYYGLPSMGIQLEAFTVAIIALSVNNGAYVTEIVRGGILSIDRGQFRAARSLGMSQTLTMRRIILPQAIRRVLPPITNESVTLVKNTALTSTIALSELLRSGLEMMTWQANTFSPFAGVALFYLALTLPLMALNNYVEKKYRVT